MRSFVPGFAIATPKSLKDATSTLAAEPSIWTPLAGGTDIMVLFEAGQLAQKRFLNIWGLAELRGIRVAADHVELGALTTYTDVQRHPLLQAEFPSLCQAGAQTGGIAIQNRGTLAGNVANASPAADSPPALLAADGELKLVSAQGERWVPYSSFHTGYKRHVMRRDELIAAIRLPRRSLPVVDYYRKVGTRAAQAISKVVMAARAERRGDVIDNVRIAFGSVAPVTQRCPRTEAVLSGRPLTASVAEEAVATLERELAPIDDIRSTELYRRAVAANLLRQFIANCGKKA